MSITTNEITKGEIEQIQTNENEDSSSKAKEDDENKKDQELLQEYLNELEEKNKFKHDLREKNIKAQENRPDDSFFSKLDSNLKKNTAFVKKLKTISDSQKDSIIKEFSSLNLTKYIGEIASALVESKLKMSDINCVLILSSLIHQRYSEFSSVFFQNWVKVFPSKKDEKINNLSKLRVDLRLFADLTSVCVLPEKEALPLLASILNSLMQNDRENHNNLSTIISFCKHCGADYAGLVSRKFRLLSEKFCMAIPQNQFLKPERQKACKNLLKSYYSSLTSHVTSECKNLRNIEKQNRKIIQNTGELSENKKETTEQRQQVFQKLLSNANLFADLLDEEPPSLPEEEIKSESESHFDIILAPRGGDMNEGDGGGLFEDEDTKDFYTRLPDLKALIPAILYKDSEQAVVPIDQTRTEEELELVEEEILENYGTKSELNNKICDNKIEDDNRLGDNKMEDNKMSEGDNKVSDNKIEDDNKMGDNKIDDDNKMGDIKMEDDLEMPAEAEEDDPSIPISAKLLLDNFFSKLPNCINREMIDKAATEFCMNLNTKSNRKKLCKTLFSVQRNRLDLLPFYARLVATLNPCMPSLSADLNLKLRSEFKYQVRKKDQINIESKLKVVRFIAELVKFEMFSKSEALYCIKILLTDFTHHNIEMTCALLENCGRFLYRSPDSHYRIKLFLEAMMRKKTATHMNIRYETMIENAYYYSNPPEISNRELNLGPPLPPDQLYIKQLLHKDLNKHNVDKQLKQLRKIDWNNNEIKSFAIKCLIQVWNMKYNCIHCLADLLSGFSSFQEEVSIRVIDAILEQIRVDMELNHPRFNQRRTSCIKYLGELYNYQLIESQTIFSTLYSLITFETSLQDSYPSPLDPPEHLFRLRLVCILLETCGSYFERGISKKKLDCFFVYFQRYYWFKKKNSIWSEECPFPRDVENVVLDVMKMLRPKTPVCQSWEEAEEGALKLAEEHKKKMEEYMKAFKGETNNLMLGTIQESETEEGEEEEPNHSKNSSEEEELEDDEGGEDEDEEEERNEEEIENESEFYNDSKPKFIKCDEDDAFLSAFDKIISDSVQQRQQELIKAPSVDIAIPVGVKNSKKSKQIISNNENLNNNSNGEKKELIPFTVLTKKGSKPQYSTIGIPLSENFASTFRERKKHELEEKEKMKKVVLEIHERQIEENYQAEIQAQQNKQVTQGNPHFRRGITPHKGVPDSSVIFGRKY